MERFDIAGPIAQVPRTLAELGDGEIVPFVIRSLIGQPCVIGYPAGTVKRRYEEAIERHKEGKFNCIEIAFMLAEQQETPPSLFLERVADAYKRNMLRFYDPDGSPYPEYVEGVSDPYCRALEYAYTTQDDVNAWLEQWGAQYRLEAGPTKTLHGERQAQQRELILQTIRNLGHNPEALPPQPKGQRGIKADTRERLKGDPLFAKPNAFNTAWKELKQHGAIKEIVA